MERSDVRHPVGVARRGGAEVGRAVLRGPCVGDVSVCVSGSMEPAFQRGDILFLTNYNEPIRVGEIVVFKVKDREIPIVHRVIKVHEKHDGKVRK